MEPYGADRAMTAYAQVAHATGLTMLRDEIEALFSDIGQLRERLDPVLTPDMAEPSSITAERAPSSALGELAARVSWARGIVGNIASRLDV